MSGGGCLEQASELKRLTADAKDDLGKTQWRRLCRRCAPPVNTFRSARTPAAPRVLVGRAAGQTQGPKPFRFADESPRLGGAGQHENRSVRDR